jgi:hypothetical protein
MSVRVRPYRRGGWEVDIRVTLSRRIRTSDFVARPSGVEVRSPALGRRLRADVVPRPHASARQRCTAQGGANCC